MDYKWIGAVLIITASGGFGFSLTAAHRREENTLRSLVGALDYMASELHFHATPLPALCRGAAEASGRGVDRVFARLAQALDASLSPEAASCMEFALENTDLPPKTVKQLQLLGKSLGRFDLEGQLQGLEEARSACRRCLEELDAHRDMRLRNYQTLSLCAGAALAILLI